MNQNEFKCVELLTDLTENYGVIGVKTSFEDEGALFNEVIRLKEICNQAKTKLTLKIGGPEAIRDMKDATIIGVKGIVAPMVESAFGLKKFINAVNKNINQDIINSWQLSINVETKGAVNDIDNIINLDEYKKLYNITIGRVDLSASMGLTRNDINNKFMFETVKKAFTKIKKTGIKTTLGGAISTESEKFIKSLHKDLLLDRFETRYILFDASVALKNYNKCLFKAQEFEYEWLNTKREYYLQLANLDLQRIEMIQNRVIKSKESYINK